MKVKIIEERMGRAPTIEELKNGTFKGSPSLEELVNDFIKDKRVVDIKYQTTNGRSVLIMYEEND